ncbi:uncharacterized protein LOC120702989 isoform X2 [Panicum virgatum]|nr:uncharacterized protein LOC120702989 isoform X2 [Panicum virgatum]
MVGMNPDSKIHVEGVAATVTGLGIRDDNRSDLEKPFADPGMCNAQFAHENDTSNLSCELCGVLRDLSLYFNNISEAEAGAKRRNKYFGVSVLARSLVTTSNSKSKAIIVSDGSQENTNATENKQATMNALHKTYMPSKKRHINIGTLHCYSYTQQFYFV